MKRDELKARGIADEDIDFVLDAWHNEQKNLLGQVQTLTQERDNARAETKKYQKDGEYYIDPNEHKRLKTFEKDTLTKEVNGRKMAALTKLYKGANASDSATKLLISTTNFDELELDDKGEVKGGVELLKKAKADYADLFAGNGNSGVPQDPVTPNGGGEKKKVPIVC